MVTVSHDLHNEGNEQSERGKLRRDRFVGVLVLLGFIALLALIIWLASFGEASPSSEFDMWMM